MNTPYSFILKLERAREHLDTFEKEAAVWVKTHPYGIVDEPDPEPPPQPVAHGAIVRRYRVTRVDPVPARLSLLIGDCVFNIRSSLDHLPLALAQSHTARMTAAQVRGSEFPLFDQAPMDPKTEKRKIGCVSPPARAAIKAMQPHHRGKDYRLDPLWQIHELNRIDKHRTLTVCVPMPRDAGRLAIGLRVTEAGMN